MQVNQNFGVAIHLLAYLSLDEEKYISSSYLASSVNTNPVVVRRILKELANHDLVETKKGKYGSRLNKKPETITLYDVYQVFYEGNILQPSHHPNSKCPVGQIVNDVVENMLNVATTNFEKTLKEFTIFDIKKQLKKGEKK